MDCVRGCERCADAVCAAGYSAKNADGSPVFLAGYSRRRGERDAFRRYRFASPTLLYSKNNNKAYVQQMYAELGYVADEDDVDGL